MIEVGNAIELLNADVDDILDSEGDDLSTDIDGLKVFLPGQLIPIICVKDNECPAFGKVTKVTITQTNTTVEYTVIKAARDVCEAAYNQWSMVSGNSVIGSYRSKTSNSRGAKFHL